MTGWKTVIIKLALVSSVDCIPASLSHWSPAPDIAVQESSLVPSFSSVMTTTTTKQPPSFASFPRSESSGTSSFSVSRASSQNHQSGDRALLGSGRSAFSGLPSSSVSSSAQSSKPSSSSPGWMGRSSYNRSITSTSATAFIRRKSPTGSGPFNRNPMKNPTDASPSSGDDMISNGEFVSKKVTGKHHKNALTSTYN